MAPYTKPLEPSIAAQVAVLCSFPKVGFQVRDVRCGWEDAEFADRFTVHVPCGWDKLEWYVQFNGSRPWDPPDVIFHSSPDGLCFQPLLLPGGMAGEGSSWGLLKDWQHNDSYRLLRLLLHLRSVFYSLHNRLFPCYPFQCILSTYHTPSSESCSWQCRCWESISALSLTSAVLGGVDGCWGVLMGAGKRWWVLGDADGCWGLLGQPSPQAAGEWVMGGAGECMGGAGECMGGAGECMGGAGECMGGAGECMGGAGECMGGAGECMGGTRVEDNGCSPSLTVQVPPLFLPHPPHSQFKFPLTHSSSPPSLSPASPQQIKFPISGTSGSANGKASTPQLKLGGPPLLLSLLGFPETKLPAWTDTMCTVAYLPELAAFIHQRKLTRNCSPTPHSLCPPTAACAWCVPPHSLHVPDTCSSHHLHVNATQSAAFLGAPAGLLLRWRSASGEWRERVCLMGVFDGCVLLGACWVRAAGCVLGACWVRAGRVLLGACWVRAAGCVLLGACCWVRAAGCVLLGACCWVRAAGCLLGIWWVLGVDCVSQCSLCLIGIELCTQSASSLSPSLRASSVLKLIPGR
ncbi:unnamed protein product [Closterium sp. NIES-54]